MTNAVFPQTIFTTQRRFNDYSTNDMRYGDMSEERLKREFGLNNISNIVDPYTLSRLSTFDNPQSRFAGSRGGSHRGRSISIHECAEYLFKELQATALLYAFVGPYRNLINEMLTHFQRSTGSPFTNAQLNAAWLEKLLSDNSVKNTKSIIESTLALFINFETRGLPQKRLKDITSAISGSALPKFNSSILDKINGMGISVHDVHAIKIEIINMNVNERGWKANVRFTGQDHFGLDTEDIRRKKFNQFQFFKIWFVLQRFSRFGFRPFLTNMEAVIEIKGEH